MLAVMVMFVAFCMSLTQDVRLIGALLCAWCKVKGEKGITGVPGTVYP